VLVCVASAISPKSYSSPQLRALLQDLLCQVGEQIDHCHGPTHVLIISLPEGFTPLPYNKASNEMITFSNSWRDLIGKDSRSV
jgi:hypothetical protein